MVAFKSWNLYASHVTGSTSAMAFRLEGYHQGEYGSETKMQENACFQNFPDTVNYGGGFCFK